MASLFGESPDILSRQLEEENFAAQRQQLTQLAASNPAFAAAASLTGGIASAGSTLFQRGIARATGNSVEDPRVRQAQQLNQIKEAIASSGFQPGSREQTNLGAELFIRAGMPERAREWVKQGLELENAAGTIEKRNLDIAEARRASSGQVSTGETLKAIMGTKSGAMAMAEAKRRFPDASPKELLDFVAELAFAIESAPTLSRSTSQGVTTVSSNRKDVASLADQILSGGGQQQQPQAAPAPAGIPAPQAVPSQAQAQPQAAPQESAVVTPLPGDNRQFGEQREVPNRPSAYQSEPLQPGSRPPVFNKQAGTITIRPTPGRGARIEGNKAAQEHREAASLYRRLNGKMNTLFRRVETLGLGRTFQLGLPIKIGPVSLQLIDIGSVDPKHKALGSAYNDVLLELKELDNLGVLNGPDLGLEQDKLPLPFINAVRQSVPFARQDPGEYGMALIETYHQMGREILGQAQILADQNQRPIPSLPALRDISPKNLVGDSGSPAGFIEDAIKNPGRAFRSLIGR